MEAKTQSLITTYLTEDGMARLIFGETDAIVAYAMEKQQTSKTVTAALGRALTAAAIMGATLKDDGGSLTLRFKGDGPAGGLTCVSDSHGNVRGCADVPQAELPPNGEGKLDVGGIIGRDGELYVVRDYGFGEPYVGHVKLVSGEIAEDITHYYAVSEQTPTVCALGVRVNQNRTLKCAGGFLLQLLPGAEDALAETLEARIRALPGLSGMLAQGRSAGDIAAMIFGDIPYREMGRTPVRFQCSCDRERYRRSIQCIGIQELKNIRDAREGAEVVCRFCAQKYFFPPEELDAMYAERVAELKAAKAARQGQETV